MCFDVFAALVKVRCNLLLYVLIGQFDYVLLTSGFLHARLSTCGPHEFLSEWARSERRIRERSRRTKVHPQESQCFLNRTYCFYYINTILPSVHTKPVTPIIHPSPVRFFFNVVSKMSGFVWTGPLPAHFCCLFSYHLIRCRKIAFFSVVSTGRVDLDYWNNNVFLFHNICLLNMDGDGLWCLV